MPPAKQEPAVAEAPPEIERKPLPPEQFLCVVYGFAATNGAAMNGTNMVRDQAEALYEAYVQSCKRLWAKGY